MPEERERDGESRAGAVIREHGAALARVCMALLGDRAAAEHALERIAAEARELTFDGGTSPLPKLMGLARSACANQLSKLPIRTRETAAWSDAPPKAGQLGREALGRLKPTEREAVVLHLAGGLDAAQVAEACGIDLDAARARIARGVSQLVEQEKKR